MARSYLFNCTSLLALLCGRVAAQDLSVKKTCHVASSNGTADDSPAIAAAFEMCGTNGTVAFAEGVNYNVLTPLHASGLSEVTIQMFGNLLLPTNLTYVQALYNATIGDSGDNFYWLSFEGSQVRYIGTPNVTTGWIQSFGQAWWDANPQNGTGVDGRPHLSLWNTTDSTIDHLKSLKPIAWNHRLTGSNITVTNAIIDAYSTGGFPFNTDGFQCAGTDITITDSVIYNGDDAIAINSGAHNVNVRRLTFGYQSHGMSIGSLGKNAASYSNVSNIFFDDITVVSALYAARFKSWIGGQGLARNITWQNVRLYNVTFPIYVTQTYIDQSSSTGERPNNSTVEIQDFHWVNWTGSIATYQPGDGSCISGPCWYDDGLLDLKHTEAIIVECNTNTSCANFEFKNIQVFPQSLDPSTVICVNATADLNPRLGFECSNATFVPTI